VFSVVESDAGHLLINASSPDERVNISPPGRNAARIYYSIDPGTSPGLYDILLEAGATRVFTPNPFPPPPVDVTDPGVVRVTPEPAGLAVLAFGGLLVLRRRRIASALE
jgi:MYXO-CTERM domain-containing protein